MDCSQIENKDFFVNLKKKIKNKNYPNSTAIAIETAKVFKDVIAALNKQNNIRSFSDLIRILRTLGNSLISIDPLQFSIGNIIKRILHLVREEHKKSPDLEVNNDIDIENKKKRLMSMTSLNTLIDFNSQRLVQNSKISFKAFNSNSSIEEDEVNSNILTSPNEFGSSNNLLNEELKAHISVVINDINSLIEEELECISEFIIEQSNEHINDNEVILTANHSDQLEEFFIEAAKKKTFTVLVAESAPTLK
jgi:translation initiation factor eIF-2B subunit beta